MIEAAQIRSAFASRGRPESVVQNGRGDTLEQDARHFESLDAADVTAQDWIDHSDAFYGFSPDAFVYFLPSLLIASLDRSHSPIIAADALVAVLDTSADPNLWNDWFVARFGRMKLAELEAIRSWAAHRLSERDGDLVFEHARLRDTIQMLLLIAES